MEDVRKQLSDFFPELANAETREEKRGEDTLYTFSRRIGTKGRRRPLNVVRVIRSVPEKRLRIFELASELLDGQGELDIDTAAAR